MTLHMEVSELLRPVGTLELKARCKPKIWERRSLPEEAGLQRKELTFSMKKHLENPESY